MEVKIEEGDIKGAIEPATMRQTEIILNQMKKSVCKIMGPKYGTGFFCKFKINNNNIQVLITNHHVIDDTLIESGDKIKVQLGNDKNPRIINLNKNKRIYSSTNREYDIMIIKLDQKDEIDDVQFLEIDNSLLKHNSELAYEDRSIYILHYPLGSEIRVSYGRGFIKDKDNNFDMIHKCKTNLGSSGSPIFDLSSNHIIGLHKCYLNRENKNEESLNLGTFLKYPLNEIKKLFQKLPKKIPNNRIPLNLPRRINTPQLMEKNNIKNRIEKANIAQDIISFNELRLDKLPNHQKINNQKNPEINNGITRNDKKIKPKINIPNHNFVLNQNNNRMMNELINDEINKLNIENKSNFHKRQKNFISFKENQFQNDKKIINQDINNNFKQNKNVIQNINNTNNKWQITNNHNKNEELYDMPVLRSVKFPDSLIEIDNNNKQNKNIQNIKNNKKINNKEQINNNNKNNKVSVDNPNKNIQNQQNFNNNKLYIKIIPNQNIQNINNNHCIEEQTNNIQNINNKKDQINNNQNINDKKEEIESNRENNNNKHEVPIKNIQFKNNQIKNNPNKKVEKNNNNEKEFNNQYITITSNANKYKNCGFKDIIYKNNKNVNINNEKIDINNNNQNINNKFIQNNNNNNNKNIDDKINLNINLRKEKESELVIRKKPLVQNLENKNIGFAPEKPTLYNNYTQTNLGRNYINNNNSKTNKTNSFNNSKKEINNQSQRQRDSIKKRIFKNKINNKNLKINVSVEDPQKFFTYKESFEKNNESPNFIPISNKTKSKFKRINTLSLKDLC